MKYMSLGRGIRIEQNKEDVKNKKTQEEVQITNLNKKINEIQKMGNVEYIDHIQKERLNEIEIEDEEEEESTYDESIR